MVKNYLTTAWRNVLAQRSSAAFNVAGLTLGISSSLVLFLMVSFMASFDDFHSKRDRIYRIVTESRGNATDYQPGVPSVLPDAFRSDFPKVEQVVFASYRAGSLINIPRDGKESIKFKEEEGVVYTEPSFFRIFDREVVSGDALSGLDQPNEAVISVSLAKKYFGREDAVGETLEFENRPYTIAAVVADAPSNTDLPFDLMLSYVTIKSEKEVSGWNSISSDDQCFFLLKENEEIQSVMAGLPAFSTKYLGEDDFDNTAFKVQALRDMHFDDRYGTLSYNTVPKEILVALSIIALVLVITACVNFVNLSTAEAIKRSKEVGVRKSLGGTRAQLILQFLGETTFITVVSILLALGCTQVALEYLNPFLEMDLSLNFDRNAALWIYLAAVAVGVSALSGLYPAFVMSAFKPALVLKNKISNRGSSGYNLRRGLVVLQFFISQLLIIVTIVIVRQMDYWEERDLGFARDATVFVPIPESEEPAAASTRESRMRTLRDEMLAVPGVVLASLSSTPPSSGSTSRTNFSVDGVAGEYTTQVKQVDGNYVDLFKLELLAGNDVEDYDTARGFLVNETFARTVGFGEPVDILGKNISLWGRRLPVVGVVKDFNTTSLTNPIEPTILFNRMRGYRTLSVKIDMRQSEEVLAELKRRWEATYPEHLFEYEFLDESIKQFYEGQRKMSLLLGSFTTLAIFIGCLGLFGLAAFMANQKTKEIGVRKVLGASVTSIIVMFSREFLVLIFIGFVLAAPLGWWAMNAFLQEFAYKIEPGVGMMFLALVITVVIALLTVGYRSIRAATVNPVQSLRYE